MSEHYPQDDACYTCHGSREIACDRCDGKGCRHCGNTGLIDCPDCQTDTHAVNWRDRCLAAEAELAKLREGLRDFIADNRQAATQSANEVLP